MSYVDAGLHKSQRTLKPATTKSTIAPVCAPLENTAYPGGRLLLPTGWDKIKPFLVESATACCDACVVETYCTVWSWCSSIYGCEKTQVVSFVFNEAGDGLKAAEGKFPYRQVERIFQSLPSLNDLFPSRTPTRPLPLTMQCILLGMSVQHALHETPITGSSVAWSTGMVFDHGQKSEGGGENSIVESFFYV